MDFDDTNRGAVWKNDRKTTEKHPDFKGSMNVEGVEYWLSGWLRAPGANPKSPSLRLSVQPKDKPAAQPASRPKDEFSDDIPF